jgi:hypothetical protein
MKLVRAAAAAAALLALAGCANSPSGPYPGSPGPSDGPRVGAGDLIPSAAGLGSRDFGEFSASDTLSIAARCTGNGAVTVSLPPTDIAMDVVCASAGPDSRSAHNDVRLGADKVAFHVQVTAEASTIWVVAVRVPAASAA